MTPARHRARTTRRWWAAGGAAVAIGLLVAVVVAVTSPSAERTGAPAAATSPPDGSTPEPGDDPRGGQRSAACDLPRDELLRVWRGTLVEASGEIQLVTTPPDYVGGGLSHAGPWDYVQRVPLLYYGPGYVRALGRVDGPASSVDIAPTNAALLGFPFEAPDGRVLARALLPAEQRPAPPRLILTLVWDGAGRNVLDAWPTDWPFLADLIDAGVWFDDAEIGSSPSNTPPIHASIGTGAYPRHHGVIDLYQEVDGDIVKPQDDGPGTLALPTLADLYDVAMGNEPEVGVVATLGAHTGMVGHGAAWEGGDEDIAVMREQEDGATGGEEGSTWELTTGMRPYFRMPAYINDVPGFEEDLARLDREDGVVDEAWGEYPFDALEGGFQTPARTPYQTRIVEEVIRREGFGLDEVPDLLYVNLKAIDSVGHIFGATGEPMGQSLRWQDESLRDLVTFLDERVGEGEWVMVLTADHGHQVEPEETGALSMSIERLTAFIEERFAEPGGAEVVRRARPTQIWMDEAALTSAGHTIDEVVDALARATREDLAGDTPFGGDPDAPAFRAVFATDDLLDLPCLEGAGA